MPENPTALLKEWGDRFEEELNSAVAEEADSLKRALSLVAALEAALRLHHRKQLPVCETCRVRWPCPTYRDITAALAEQEADDDGPT